MEEGSCRVSRSLRGWGQQVAHLGGSMGWEEPGGCLVGEAGVGGCLVGAPVCKVCRVAVEEEEVVHS